ncbi:MAG: sulfotransferase [Hyphomicrobiales bacterium]|nr:sulfotransferase [Hyphomicrobiales bacterium]
MTKLPTSFTKHPAPQRQGGASRQSVADKMEATLLAAKQMHERGDHAGAQKLCAEVLTRDPKSTRALMLAGSIARSLKDLRVAIEMFRRAVARQPNSPDLLFMLASIYCEDRDFEPGIKAFERGLAMRPNSPGVISDLARAYFETGQIERSIPLYEKALLLAPTDRSIRESYAEALSSAGRMEEAAALLRKNIASGFHIGLSYKRLAETQKFTADPPELGSIRSELARAGLAAQEVADLNHASGKILNDLGRYGEAVDYFQRGKLAIGVGFNLASARRSFDTLISSFTPELFTAKAGIGNPSEVPVFILGMPRSGTSLAEQICASHPAVFGAGELVKLGKALRAKGYGLPDDVTAVKSPEALTGEEANSIAGDYLEFLRRKSPTAARIVDKMPHNFLRIGFIALLFPNARIIHCTRDPIDTCVSCFMTTFNDKHGYNTDLHTLGLYYREYDRLMRHWKSVLPGRIHECSYEALVADTETETRRMIDYLGLPWDDACLRFYATQRSVATPSRWQVRQPIYGSSVKRWKNYEDKIEPLIEALGDLAKV